MQRLGSQVLDLLVGLPTLVALGRERGPAARVRELGQAHRQATNATLRTAFLSSLVLELVTTLSVALVAVEVGLRLLHGDLDLRTALAVLVLAPEVYLPLRQVGTHFHASTDGLAAVDAAFAVLERPLPADGTDAAPRPADQHHRAARRRRAARGPGEAAPAGLSLTLQPGTVVALTGPERERQDHRGPGRAAAARGRRRRRRGGGRRRGAYPAVPGGRPDLVGPAVLARPGPGAGAGHVAAERLAVRPPRRDPASEPEATVLEPRPRRAAGFEPVVADAAEGWDAGSAGTAWACRPASDSGSPSSACCSPTPSWWCSTSPPRTWTASTQDVVVPPWTCCAGRDERSSSSRTGRSLAAHADVVVSSTPRRRPGGCPVSAAGRHAGGDGAVAAPAARRGAAGRARARQRGGAHRRCPRG